MAKRIIIAIFNVELVEGFIDSLDIVGLDGAKPFLDELDLAIASEDVNNTGGIKLTANSVKDFIKFLWIKGEVEIERAVKNVWVGNGCNEFLEFVMVPGN